MEFKLHSEFSPTGDQPKAIEKIVENLENEYGDNVKRYLMRCIEKN